jgi:phosphoglycolate phosphatase-like HAD superfamily hydrolase
LLSGRPVRGVVLDLDGTLVNTTVDFVLMKRRVVDALLPMGSTTMLDGGEDDR